MLYIVLPYIDDERSSFFPQKIFPTHWRIKKKQNMKNDTGLKLTKNSHFMQ